MTTTAPFVGGSQYLVEEVKLGFQLDENNKMQMLYV
jgi:hypothetical protein